MSSFDYYSFCSLKLLSFVTICLIVNDKYICLYYSIYYCMCYDNSVFKLVFSVYYWRIQVMSRGWGIFYVLTNPFSPFTLYSFSLVCIFQRYRAQKIKVVKAWYINTMKTTFDLNFYLYQVVKQPVYTLTQKSREAVN